MGIDVAGAVRRCACGDPPGTHTSAAKDTLWWLATLHKDMHVVHVAVAGSCLEFATIYRPWQCHSSAWLARTLKYIVSSSYVSRFTSNLPYITCQRVDVPSHFLQRSNAIMTTNYPLDEKLDSSADKIDDVEIQKEHSVPTEPDNVG